MNDPRRLREDTAFVAETGARLAAVDTLWQEEDLARVAARFGLDGGAAVGRPARRVRWARVAAVAAGTVAVMLVLSALAIPRATHVDAEDTRGTPVLLRPASPVPPPAPPPGPVPAAPDPAGSSPAIDPQRPPRQAAAVRLPPPEPATAPEPSVSAPPTPPVPSLPPSAEPPGGRLREQERAIAAARDTLAEGRAADALAGFDAYLLAWPLGVLRAEAALGRLDALAALGRWEEVIRDLDALPEAVTGEVASVRLTRFRVEAMVHSGRCREADAAAASLPRREQVEIRRRCAAAP